MKSGQKIYFLSDFHLGVPDHARSLERERRIVAFLNEAAKDAAEIHILGDLFDMWFEYREVVPRGFVRLLGTIAHISDRGIPVHLYIGNHDMWVFDYLPKETGVIIHRAEVERTWNGQRFLIGHGDGLGPGDHGYKFIKRGCNGASPGCTPTWAWGSHTSGAAAADGRTTRTTGGSLARTRSGWRSIAERCWAARISMPSSTATATCPWTCPWGRRAATSTSATGSPGSRMRCSMAAPCA